MEKVSIGELYRSGDRQFFPLHYSDPADQRTSVVNASSRFVSQAALTRLSSDNDIASSAPQLRKLSQQGTVAVIGGQQCGLFLGPLMVIYKAMTILAAAKAFESLGHRPAVPIFWMQDEDHDFYEIASTTLGLASETKIFTLPARDNRSSIRHLPLGPDVGRLREELLQSLARFPFVDEVEEILAPYSEPERTFSEAFLESFKSFFQSDGILVFDPRSPEVQSGLYPRYQEVILNGTEIEKSLSNRIVELRNGGFPEQVPLREGTSLFAFHLKDETGPRYRLKIRGKDFVLPSGDILRSEELLRISQESPLRLSSTALLRPLLQDTLFPTAAFVGGLAEIGYQAELPPLYDYFGIPQPLLIPRASVALFEPRLRTLFSELKFTVEDLSLPADHLLRRCCKTGEQYDREALKKAFLGQIEIAFSEFQNATLPLQQDLRTATKKTRQNIEFLIDKLLERVSAVAAQYDHTSREKVERLQSALAPQGRPQERVFSPWYYVAKYGREEFKKRISVAIEPFLPSRFREVDL
jgi:bacillithiol synthase